MTVAVFVDDSRGPIIRAHPQDSVASVIRLLADKRIGCVPIVDDGRVVGIFSERDVIYGLSGRGADLLSLEVGEVMTSPPVTIASDTPIMDALALMTRRRIRHLPIVEDEQMVGFISIGDLVKLRIDHVEAEAGAMRAYIQMA